MSYSSLRNIQSHRAKPSASDIHGSYFYIRLPLLSHHSTTPSLRPSFLQHFDQIGHKPRRTTPINDAMVVGEPDWHHESRFDFSIVHAWLERAAAQAENCHLGPIDNGCEVRSAKATLVRDRK